MSQPVIYLCNGFGFFDGQHHYKSIAAIYKSFDTDYLNTAEVKGRPEQIPWMEAEVKDKGLQKWEGVPVGQSSSIHGSPLPFYIVFF